MKPIIFFLACLVPVLTFAQISFEEVTPPVDFSYNTIWKSPSGEYFTQATNDKKSIYSSVDGVTWTKQSLPITHTLEDVVFFNDGTPLLQSENYEHLIRRQGVWYTMAITSSYDDVSASFIKNDTLFVYQDRTFGYSLDKGKNFTVDFVYSKGIIDHSAHLWKVDNHYVLHHTAGAADSLSVFTESGTLVFHKRINVSLPKFVYNSCDQVLIYDRTNYYLLKDQGLNLISGSASVIIPNISSNTVLFFRNGHYVRRYENTLYATNGCDFVWHAYETHDLIQSSKSIWFDEQENLFLVQSKSDSFVEHPHSSSDWMVTKFGINDPYVIRANEAGQEHQHVLTSNNLFLKAVSASDWHPLDTIPEAGLQADYSPNGDLYLNLGTSILYSQDNGNTFSSISVPDTQLPFYDYRMWVLDDQVLFIFDDLWSSAYYTLDNGQHWISTLGGSFYSISLPLIKRVGDFIIVAEMEYQYIVSVINIITNKVTTFELGDFTSFNFSGPVILDDGTIYFQAFDFGGSNPEGFFRFHPDEGVSYLGEFPEFQDGYNLFASGNDVFSFGTSKYSVYNGETVEQHAFSGLPSSGSRDYYIAKNEYLYVVVNHSRLFRSTAPLTYKKYITGAIRQDKQADCVTDTADTGLRYWKVNVASNNYSRSRVTNHSGEYTFNVPDGDYTLTAQPLNWNWEICSDTYSVSIDDQHPEVRQDFVAHGLTKCAELDIDFSTPLLRRCFENYYIIRVRNTGPDASAGTTLTLQLDPYFESVSATVPFTWVNDSLIQFDLGILEVNEEITFKLQFKLSCNAPLGAEHCITGILSDDHLCESNRSAYTECQHNIGSYDPNDKRIFNAAGKETSTIDKNEYIYYHIRFQNTGTDTAFRVRIIDPLSPLLDLSTLEVMSASHPYTYEITDGPALAVEFRNIQLPDSTANEPFSHGFLKFRIKPLNDLPYGTSIPNQADIYFDFNEGVLTNETLLVLQQGVGTKDIRSQVDFTLLPNPARNSIYLEMDEEDWADIHSFEIIDLAGRIFLSSRAVSGKLINIGSLASGLYQIVLKSEAGVVGTRTFVKM